MILLSILIISEYQEVNANQTEISSEIETSKQTEEATSDVQETTMKQQETTVNHQEFVTENNLAGWVKTSRGYKYRYANGKYATYGFIKVGGKKYFIGKDGCRKSGLKTYHNKKYYIVNGLLYNKTGIIKYRKNKYYSKKGLLKKGLKKIGKSYYFFHKKKYNMIKNKLIKIDGNYYYFNGKGKGIKKSKGSSAAIDLIKKITSPKDSKQAKLWKGFNYMVKHYRYAVKPGFFVPSGKGWEEDFGYNMIKTHSGRCYSFAAAFCLYAREVGYKANAVVGAISGNIPHGWCEVKQGSTWYTYDPDLSYENNNISTYYKRTYASMGGFYHKHF